MKMDKWELQRLLEDIKYHLEHGEMALAESKQSQLPVKLKSLDIDKLPTSVTDSLWELVKE